MEDEQYTEPNKNKGKLHPKARANIISRLCFCWAIPFFIKGLKKDLSENDLYGPLKEHEAKKLGDKLVVAWKKHLALTKSFSFPKVMIKVFYKEYLFFSFFMVIQELVVKMGQPLLVGKLLAFYVPYQTSITLEQAYIYGFGIVLLSFLDRMIQHSSFFGMQHLALKMQVACRCIIYDKSLKINSTSKSEYSVGQIINLISSDVSRFAYICLHLHQVFIAPIQIVVVLYLIFDTLTPAGMVGVALIIGFTPFQYLLGKKTSFYRLRTAQKTDRRIRLMNEIIGGIKLIKMYTWEIPFAKLVRIARKSELNEITANFYLRTIYGAIGTFLIRTCVFCCVLAYVLSENALQAQFVYVVASFYGTLRQPVTIHLPRCIAVLAELRVLLRRIQTFLLYDEVPQLSSPDVGKLEEDNVGIVMDKVFVKYNAQEEDEALQDFSLKIDSPQLVAIIGPVGGGKTTLFLTLLREIPIDKGNLAIRGSVSYAAQEPWLFTASMRQNILFGQTMDAARYQDVVRVCELEKDFALLQHGDLTLVGEKGVMLSGGQKARVSLARAIYKNADIYLLDDPLSAVDAHVGKEIFNNCITGYLQHKCVILITHQIQYLSNVNKMFLIENGSITASGTLEEVKNTENSFVDMLKDKTNLTNDAENEKDDVNTESLKKVLKKQASFKEKNKAVDVKEKRSVGTISGKVYLQYFQTGNSYCLPFTMTAFFMFTQLGASGVDYFLTLWVNHEEKKLKVESNSTEAYKEDTVWTPHNMLYIYATVIVFLIVMSLARSICFVKFSMRAAQNLHNNMFQSISFATMRFFDTNPSGRILNRFSRDLNIVDEELPVSLLDTLRIFLEVVSITILLSLVNPWLIIPSVIMFSIFYAYKAVFLATSRDLKRIEGTARSPMFSHLAASLQGLPTIRAFHAEEILKKEFATHLNNHSAAAYMFMSCSRTFAFWLDMTCIVYIGLVILSFLVMGTDTYGGNVGLAITQSITLTGMLQSGIREWSALENHMTSVERLIEYSDLPSEPDTGNKNPPITWPNEGKIVMKDLSMRYAENMPTVLQNLDLKINPKEKIGIVGRTGAGKSSFVSTLFRLAPLEGSIAIDNLACEDMPLGSLRSKLSIIPQEPILFSGTLRKNLDPFDEYDDKTLWNALNEVELGSALSEIPGGLSAHVADGGANFSVGERQLLCLARAIVRNNKILILDEATANVDLQTDKLIQNTIRQKFKDCTVLTVAHRLHTVMDSDKILVLNEGRIEQFDHPYTLLQNKEGIFYGLVQETGKGVADGLTDIALQSYKLKNST